VAANGRTSMRMEKMKIASSWNYLGIQVTITVDQIVEKGTISYLNQIKTVATMDMRVLKRMAELAIDKEKDDRNLYNNGD
jgi:hypothetical protein